MSRTKVPEINSKVSGNLIIAPKNDVALGCVIAMVTKSGISKDW